MGQFRYVPEHEVVQRHHQAKAKRIARAQEREASAPTRNVEPVLSLGEMTYFQFRGRAYGVPPLPWKSGQRLLAVYTRTIALADQVARTGDKAAEREYFQGLGKLQTILWRLCRPTGLFRRLLRVFYLHRNPFRAATEKEILDHADFFCSLRTKSSVRFSPEPTMPQPHPRMHLTS